MILESIIYIIYLQEEILTVADSDGVKPGLARFGSQSVHIKAADAKLAVIFYKSKNLWQAHSSVVAFVPVSAENIYHPST